MSPVDVTYGNVSQEDADRLDRAVGGGSFAGHGAAGDTESWVVNVIVALLKASGHRTVLETGAFRGATSLALAQALQDLGGGTLTVSELDPLRAEQVDRAMREGGLDWPAVQWVVRAMDALDVIRSHPDQSLGFVFVDDDHEAAHVTAEVEALLPKMVPNGLIVFHDVWGVCDLRTVVEGFGGYALDFPRAGPAGGLGVLQVRP